MKPVYVNALVKDATGKEGRVISIDKNAQIAVVRSNSSYWTDDIKKLEVISYREI